MKRRKQSIIFFKKKRKKKNHRCCFSVVSSCPGNQCCDRTSARRDEHSSRAGENGHLAKADPHDGEDDDEEDKSAASKSEKKEPLSMEALLRRKEAEKEAQSRPVFLSKKQREEMAIAKRQAEVLVSGRALVVERCMYMCFPARPLEDALLHTGSTRSPRSYAASCALLQPSSRSAGAQGLSVIRNRSRS